MYPRGHAGLALTLYAPILYLTATKSFIGATILTLCVMWTAILPDIDISNKLFLDRLDHRGTTHTVWFALVIGMFGYVCGFGLAQAVQTVQLQPQRLTHSTLQASVGATSAVGICLHICGDVINKQSGVSPWAVPRLQKFTRPVHIPLLHCHSLTINNLLFVTGVLILSAVLWFGSGYPV